MSTLREINKEIKKAKSIVILTHENPDGDAIGSVLALYNHLKNQDKLVHCIVPEYSKIFRYLPGIEDLKTNGNQDEYDLAISVDCATIKLLNGWSSYFENAKTRIVIDHHSTNEMYGDVNFVDYTSPANCQILAKLFMEYGWKINKDIGTCLMAGIITDTGGFQYPGVTKETFEITSHLIDIGINVSKIYKTVFETHTKSSFELKRIALNRMEFIDDGKIAFTYITNDDENKVHAQTGDYEGIVNEGCTIEGVEVSIFLHELDKEDGFKISLRSNDYVNVSDALNIFGGGGHPRAAGAKLSGNPEEIKNRVIKEVERQLK